jgi:formylglycine-generating enzyme required for sulfatase activity
VGKTLSVSYVTRLLQDVLEVLAFVHEQNVIHRDLKPSNLMRDQNGQVYLIDFGAVKQLSSLQVNAGGTVASTVVIGTPGFMPSEQSRGKPTLSSDVYAVGMVAIAALTGLLPEDLQEDPDTGELLWQAKLQTSVPPELRDFLTKLVRRHPTRRFATAGEALQAFKTLLPKLTPTPSPIPKSPPQPTKVSPRGFGELLGQGVTLEMVEIPGGTFMMGSPDSEKGCNPYESPQHRVTVKPFFMGKFPVTQAQYEAVMGTNPAEQYDRDRFAAPGKPVVGVNWHDAVAFCQKLSEQTGREYRLPSEAEWEYACRAGTTTPFYFGETITTDIVNFNGEGMPYGNAPPGVSRGATTEVGSFPPNAFGLFDMHGNVWEWCEDVRHRNYQGAPTDGSAWIEGGHSSVRLLRGGSWLNNPWFCRSAYRYKDLAGGRFNDYGFQVVCRPPRTP